jgi:hypothetical protein
MAIDLSSAILNDGAISKDSISSVMIAYDPEDFKSN